MNRNLSKKQGENFQRFVMPAFERIALTNSYPFFFFILRLNYRDWIDCNLFVFLLIGGWFCLMVYAFVAYLKDLIHILSRDVYIVCLAFSLIWYEYHFSFFSRMHGDTKVSIILISLAYVYREESVLAGVGESVGLTLCLHLISSFIFTQVSRLIHLIDYG